MRLVDYLEEGCIKAVTGLSKDSARSDYSRVTYNDGLKSSILLDPLVTVSIDDNATFSITEDVGGLNQLDGPSIAEGRLVDFVLGARRVKAQYKNLMDSKRAGVNTGWMVVTAYYSAFFAAIEILRLQGIFPLNLDSDDFADLCRKATGSEAVKKSFSDAYKQDYVGQIAGDRIIFRSGGGKPHVTVWDQARKHIIERAARETGWPEIIPLNYFMAGDRNWQNPSKLRNEWNYKRADLFCASGRGINFRKLVGNPGASLGWLAQARHADEESKLSVLAVLAEAFCNPVINGLERVRNSGVLETNS